VEAFKGDDKGDAPGKGLWMLSLGASASGSMAATGDSVTENPGTNESGGV